MRLFFGKFRLINFVRGIHLFQELSVLHIILPNETRVIRKVKFPLSATKAKRTKIDLILRVIDLVEDFLQFPRHRVVGPNVDFCQYHEPVKISIEIHRQRVNVLIQGFHVLRNCGVFIIGKSFSSENKFVVVFVNKGDVGYYGKGCVVSYYR